MPSTPTCSPRCLREGAEPRALEHVAHRRVSRYSCFDNPAVTSGGWAEKLLTSRDLVPPGMCRRQSEGLPGSTVQTRKALSKAHARLKEDTRVHGCTRVPESATWQENECRDPDPSRGQVSTTSPPPRLPLTVHGGGLPLQSGRSTELHREVKLSVIRD